MSKHFNRIFYRNEIKALRGIKYRNFIGICGIFFLTFLAIGFANGSLEYLSSKMTDPFVNWLDIGLDYDEQRNINRYIEILSDSINKSDYQYTNISTYQRYFLIAYDFERKGSIPAMGRTIKFDDPLVNEILSKWKIEGKSFNSENDIGLIVKERFLEKINHDFDNSYLGYKYNYNDTFYVYPIPIIAVVKELPGSMDFISTKAAEALYNGYLYNQLNPNDNADLVCLFSDNSFLIEKKEEIIEFLNNIYGEYLPNVTIESGNVSYKPQGLLYISFIFDSSSPDEISAIKNDVYSDIRNYLNLDENEILRYFNDEIVNLKQSNLDEFLTININSLDKLPELKAFLLEKLKLEIDVAKYSSMQNYNYVSKLTKVISLILITFSITILSLFLSNVLKNHFEKIKKNIGTLKAFGVPDYFFRKGYYFIVTGLFTPLAIVVSIGLSSLIGYFGGVRFLLGLIESNIEKEYKYFELLNSWTLVTVFFSFLCAFYVTKYTMNMYLNKTPGNLIFNKNS